MIIIKITTIGWLIIGLITVFFSFVKYYKTSRMRTRITFSWLKYLVVYTVLWPMAWIQEMTESRITGKRSLFDPVTFAMIIVIYIISLIGLEAVFLQHELNAQKRASSIYGRIIDKNNF